MKWNECKWIKKKSEEGVSNNVLAPSEGCGYGEDCSGTRKGGYMYARRVCAEGKGSGKQVK